MDDRTRANGHFLPPKNTGQSALLNFSHFGSSFTFILSNAVKRCSANGEERMAEAKVQQIG